MSRFPPARRILFCAKPLVTFEEARQGMSGDKAAGSSSAVVNEGVVKAANNPNSDEGDDRDWNFDDVPVDSQVDERASLRADFDVIREQCQASNLERLANENVLFGFALQNVSAVTERDVANLATYKAVKRAHVAEQPRLAQSASWA